MDSVHQDRRTRGIRHRNISYKVSVPRQMLLNELRKELAKPGV
jgi:hypothetical protein